MQLAWAGYVCTTDLDAIYYLISDKYSTPEDKDAYHVKTLPRCPMDGCVTPQPLNAPIVGPLPFGRNGYITFYSFSNPAKINEDMLTVWAQILAAAPHSKLLLHYANMDVITVSSRLTKSFAAKGIDPERLELKGGSPHTELLTV